MFKKRKRKEFLDKLKYGHLSEDAKLQKLLIEAIMNNDDDGVSKVLAEMIERRAKRVR